MADKFFNDISQIRVTELLDTGAADPSATAKTSTVPKELSADFVYDEGEELTQTGGGETVCTITEEDEPKGADVEITLATLEYDVKGAIAGGTVNMTGPDATGWDFPTSTPGPFKLEVWVPKFDTTSSTEGKPDGYLYIVLPYCKGRMSKRQHAGKGFGEDVFSIKARQNPNSGDSAWQEDEVATIV
ncbi:hypothetical protein M0R72_18035 [Candidatus Pacearchaeota archaeon]|jgi:hypothetical protein|nr:hypothetical protein [Candidatus Pacearchaeota archaeon]